MFRQYNDFVGLPAKKVAKRTGRNSRAKKKGGLFDGDLGEGWSGPTSHKRPRDFAVCRKKRRFNEGRGCRGGGGGWGVSPYLSFQKMGVSGRYDARGERKEGSLKQRENRTHGTGVSIKKASKGVERGKGKRLCRGRTKSRCRKSDRKDGTKG